MNWLWHTCVHRGIHCVDLTWKGAVALSITFVIGLAVGWRPCGRGPSSVEQWRDVVREQPE